MGDILQSGAEGNKMNKEEFVKKYGGAAYKRKIKGNNMWKANNPDRVRMHDKTWRDNNPSKTEAKDHERNRKGGRYYERKMAYLKQGVPGERHIVRTIHARRWRKYKKIIAPDSQLHHEWIPGTAEYRGIALVEGDAHQHGIIDVIEILEGMITVLLEGRGKLAKMCP
jgi:hypothetical protein